MYSNTNINVTRRIALMTLMGAALSGFAGNPRIVGAVVGGSALAGVIGSAVRQQRIDEVQNVRTAAPARRPALG